ncbi:MAG: menaquinone biosynthesis protein [Phycisphaerae bacterium]|nr:menaquinone biosynthesis protein [Phycisphaerae bacterium]
MITHMKSNCRRLGVVSYLNAKPLIAGLDHDPAFDLRFEVPSKLPALLESAEVECALVPVIDILSAGSRWKIVSDACIGCDGETFTVRVFSRVPAEKVRILHVDGDSHTSVALARTIWRESYGYDPEIVPLESAAGDASRDAILLIGDKVVTSRPVGYDLEIDLGSAWKSLTSLPFVFAAWAVDRDADVGDLAARLGEARDRGVRSAAMIAADFGPGMGWPVTLATRYLTQRLKFTLGPRQREGMARFRELLARHGRLNHEEELIFA